MRGMLSKLGGMWWRMMLWVMGVAMGLGAARLEGAGEAAGRSAEAIVEAMIARDRELVDRREGMVYTLVTRREKLDGEGKVVSVSEEQARMRGSEKVDYGTRPEGKSAEADLEKAAREEPFEILRVASHYDYTLEKSERVHGQLCYVVGYRPKAGMPYRNREEKVLNHVTGRMWIRQSDHSLLRNEGRLIKPVAVAWFMATLRDLEFVFETGRLPNGDFGPARVVYRFRVQVLFARIHERHVRTMSEYR